MFEYMTVQEAAKLWEISERRTQKLCEGNRIDGVVRLSRVWLIPKDVKNLPMPNGRYNYDTSLMYNCLHKE